MPTTRNPELTSASFRSNLTYRIIAGVVAGGVALFFLVVLLPQVKSLFMSFGGKVPASTSLLVQLSDFALSFYGVAILVAVVTGIRLFIWTRKKRALSL